MTDRTLLRLANEFILGLLNGDKPNGMCFFASASLQGYLYFYKIETEMQECEVNINADKFWNHYYLKLEDGRILDPTASQFNEELNLNMPLVYLGVLPNHYNPIIIQKK